MEEPPQSLNEPILNSLRSVADRHHQQRLRAVGLLLFGHYLFVHQSAIEGRSFAFASFAVNSMIYIFAYRSLRRSIFKSRRSAPTSRWSGRGQWPGVAVLAFVVPGLRAWASCRSAVQWAAVFAVALGLLVIVEAGKAVSNAACAPHLCASPVRR